MAQLSHFIFLCEKTNSTRTLTDISQTFETLQGPVSLTTRQSQSSQMPKAAVPFKSYSIHHMWIMSKKAFRSMSKDDPYYLVLLPVCLQFVHQKTGHFPSGSDSCLCFICRWDGVLRTRTGCSILYRLSLMASGIVPLVHKKSSDLCRNKFHVSLLLGWKILPEYPVCEFLLGLPD